MSPLAGETRQMSCRQSGSLRCRGYRPGSLLLFIPSRHTSDMIRFAEEFAISIPGRELLNHCQYFGGVSGRDVNKVELARLNTFKANKVEAPLIEGCLAYIECGLEAALRVGDHTLFIGRVAAVQAERGGVRRRVDLGR